MIVGSGARRLLSAHTKPRNGGNVPTGCVARNAHLSTRNAHLPTRCFAQTNKNGWANGMAYRHRDRENHRRSLVDWESVLKPLWILSVPIALWSLGAWWDDETPVVILSYYVLVAGCGSDSGRNLVATTSIGLVGTFRGCRIYGFYHDRKAVHKQQTHVQSSAKHHPERPTKQGRAGISREVVATCISQHVDSCHEVSSCTVSHK